ncbi:MAG: NAD(P) transhydrogenase subunit alpha [Acidobacteria bacterium]|nr:NAD(P) transhydrogenase subunit alpha [Acidobacteriota bacterium]
MTGTVDPAIINVTIFVLAIFVGYHVVWNVTPALHTPLMSVTNAISSVIMVGAILAAGPGTMSLGAILGAIAVGLVAINTFGGFMVSQRMLAMFKKKQQDAGVPDGGRTVGQVPDSGRDVGRVPRSGPAE